MANREIGEYEFEALERKWTLRFGASALAAIETELDRPITEIIEDISNPRGARITTLFAFMWAGLMQHHAGIEIETVHQMFDKIGMEQFAGHLEAGLLRAFPDAAGEAAGPNPPKRRAKANRKRGPGARS